MLQDADEIHLDGSVPVDRERLFGSMLAVTTDPLYALDERRQIVAVDDQLLSLTGHDREQLLGHTAENLLSDDDMRALEMMVAKVSRQGGTMAGEFDLLMADGTARRCELRVATPDEEGETVVAAVKDVTGLQRREERIEVLDRVLRHNIRNKVGTVLGYLETLLDDADDEDTTRRARVAKNEANELLSLSNKARRFHKLLELDPVRTTVEDLHPTVESVVEEYRDDHPDVEFGVEFSTHPPVFVDEELVEAALEEVVGNAIEHHDGDHPTVEVSAAVEDTRVRLRVADDGPGVPPKEREAIMEGNERPLYHASGLGIWFVKWCLQLSGGELFLEPNDPRGTVVVLSLPRADVEADP